MKNSGPVTHFRWYQFLLAWAAGWVVLLGIAYITPKLWPPANPQFVLIPIQTSIHGASTALAELWRQWPSLLLFLIIALVFNAAMLVWLVARIRSRYTPV